MAQDTYISDVGVFYRDEELNFEFVLMLGENLVPLSGVDIAVTVYSSQLSPRKYVVSNVRESTLGSGVSDLGGSITRYGNKWVLTLSPVFLEVLDVGVLTFRIQYTSDSFSVTSLIATSKFI